MSRVTVIPPTINQQTYTPSSPVKRRRVAAYARVSTDSDEQFTSYEAQVDYYTRYIMSKPEWMFSGMYSDEGITAVNTRRRDGFKQMIADALDGKIDLIITKSVSRFARNTVDSLVTIRKLKEKNIEVYFEKEGIYSLDGKGELLLTIMSSLAQEESRSISENVKWGARKRFADGKISVAYSTFLGYEKGDTDGTLRVVEKEAEIVRLIYRMCLEGKTPTTIARKLTQKKIPTPARKEKWHPSTVLSILTNEKYKGDALLQKTYTADFLTKETKVNRGEVPQYYVQDSHEAIVSREVFDLVQEELERRKNGGVQSSSVNLFAGRLICGECGSFYGAKLWHSTDRYRKTVHQCNHKFTNERKCSTPHVDEHQLKRAFVSSFNELFSEKAELMNEYEQIISELSDTSSIERKLRALETEQGMIADQLQGSMSESISIDQSDYNQRYDSLFKRYEAITSEIEALSSELTESRSRSELLREFMAEVSSRDGILAEFDESLWYSTVDKVTVTPEKELIFRYRNGDESTIEIV